LQTSLRRETSNRQHNLSAAMLVIRSREEILG
jgi:hypothetical protein